MPVPPSSNQQHRKIAPKAVAAGCCQGHGWHQTQPGWELGFPGSGRRMGWQIGEGGAVGSHNLTRKRWEGRNRPRKALPEAKCWQQHQELSL